jgi:hypothetical protein
LFLFCFEYCCTLVSFYEWNRRVSAPCSSKKNTRGLLAWYNQLPCTWEHPRKQWHKARAMRFSA